MNSLYLPNRKYLLFLIFSSYKFKISDLYIDDLGRLALARFLLVKSDVLFIKLKYANYGMQNSNSIGLIIYTGTHPELGICKISIGYLLVHPHLHVFCVLVLYELLPSDILRSLFKQFEFLQAKSTLLETQLFRQAKELLKHSITTPKLMVKGALSIDFIKTESFIE